MVDATHNLYPSPIPSYTLFDSRAVGLAALFGSPAAGTSLLALNYRRLGQQSKAVLIFLAGLLATAFLILIGWTLPHSATTPLALICLFAVVRGARSLQGPAVSQHQQQGGRLASRWAAFGWGVACFAVLFGVMFMLVPATALSSPTVTIGTKDEVHYAGSATKEDALALGKSLQTHGYFQDRGVTVSLNKGAQGTVISFVTREGSWDQPDILPKFEELVREVAPAVGGLPVHLRLTDQEDDTKKQSDIGLVDLGGGDDIYFAGTASRQQAEALGASLKKSGFLSGHGADVFLSRHDDGTAMAFVMADGTWNKPNEVSQFETIVRDAAPAVGGLPVKVRLLSTTLDVQKEWIVK